MRLRLRFSDVSIFCGLIALIVFGHATMWRRPAHAGALSPLMLQGTGAAYMSYAAPVNERATALEYNARWALLELGAAESGYASSRPDASYAYLQELVTAGYLQPNQTGRSLASSYSITFYINSSRQGFTLVAEPLDIDLRPFMLTENQQVVLLTPSVYGDPNEAWATVRQMENSLLYDKGRYDFLNSLQLIGYDPPLQVRLNRERTSYALHSLIADPEGEFYVDDSLIYIGNFASYMLGDIRQLEDYSP